MKLYDLKDPLNLDYARTRLVGTIVTRNGKAITIDSITNDLRVVYLSLSTGQISECSYEEIDINPVKLGYVNYNRQAVYFFRVPMRRDWKQGLRNQTLATTKGRQLDRIPSKSLAKLIEGSYPTFNKALERMTSENTRLISLAFSRNFAIDKELGLFYKDKYRIGQINSDNGTYELEPQFMWAVETLEEDLV